VIREGPERRPREGGGPFSFLVSLTLLAASAFADDSLPSPLTGTAGDPATGRKIVLDRHVGLCLLCHSGPFPEERFQGSLAPDLTGVGGRLSAGQIRLRIVDPSRVNPKTIMPAYYRTEDLQRVAPAYRGKTVLGAQQIEDIVAFLVTLK
jgi:sulfur-oxidizing protein SoxX